MILEGGNLEERCACSATGSSKNRLQLRVPWWPLPTTPMTRRKRLLLKLARGAGLKGLSGIYPRLQDQEGRLRVIRPFLSFRRQEILDYLERRRMTFRTDASNLSTHLDRNLGQAGASPSYGGTPESPGD